MKISPEEFQKRTLNSKALLVKSEEILEKSKQLEENLLYFDSIGQPLIDEASKELDDKMKEIETYMTNIRKFNLDFDIASLQRYFMEITQLVYFTNDKLERVGLLEDMSRIQYRDKYNNAYIEKQGNTEAGKKFSVAQLQAYSDQVALSENLLNFIYSRCYKIIKAKVDAGENMIKCLSKLLSSKMLELQNVGRM